MPPSAGLVEALAAYTIWAVWTPIAFVCATAVVQEFPALSVMFVICSPTELINPTNRFPEDGNCITVFAVRFWLWGAANNVYCAWTTRIPGGGGVPAGADLSARASDPHVELPLAEKAGVIAPAVGLHLILVRRTYLEIGR